ncbi:MAG: NAD(P)/FAD-dependent oxidoreductase [Candidatus Pacebacteria bacterium]|jgi:geranylgeranyl reductase|nr:NAD(P)/FAD-dependent oxidoreductase [Candidatus Paceibacterota bacterium]
MNQAKEHYDVVIIGAGPAGLACATELSKSALRILILEQKDIIGPKICAGGLTRKDFNHIQVPEQLMDVRFKEMTLHASLLNTTLKDKCDMLSTIDRRKFATWQLRKLEGLSNVEIKTGCKVIAIDKEKVALEDLSSYGYKYLIGADGAFSCVRRFLGVKTEDTAIAIQYIIPTDRYKKLEFFFDSKLFHAWYAWIFPHDSYVSIGCMCDPRNLSAKKLQKNFNKWLSKKNIDVSKGKFEGYAINYDYRGYRFGNIFLAGDAAGLGSGLTGEGIYQAIVSGEEVAKTVLDEKYEAPGIKDLLETKRLQNNAMRALIKMGPLRNIVFFALIPAVKNKKLVGKILKYIS